MGIGDELMAAGEAAAQHARTGRPVRILRQPGRGVRWCDVWNDVPYLVGDEPYRDADPLYAKDANGLRPYIVAKTREQWTWRAYTPKPAELAFTMQEIELGQQAIGAVLVEPHIKPGASTNKDWGWERWQALVSLRPDLQWLQSGPAGTQILRGARHVHTSGFRLAAALLYYARAAVLPEGGLHHAAAAVRTPAVVIRGGFIGPRVTGYPWQRDLFVESADWPLGCGARAACKHCAAAMASIAPERVAQELEVLLETDRRGVAA